MKVKGYITHKDAENYSDCADYFRICPSSRRMAVSDGVSQSIMPAEWARILVDAYVSGEWNPGEDIANLQAKWLNEANAFLASQSKAGKNPWMLANCLASKEGAGSTICGVEFKDEKHWSASILGDSCLVKVDKNKRVLNIYSSKDSPFGNRPDYFDSFSGIVGEIRHFEGETDEGETLLLVSDPFSELFQKNQGTEKEQGIIDQILSIKNYDGFVKLVDVLRHKYSMHNDDSTLLIIQPDGSASIVVTEEKTLPDLIEEERIRLETERIELQKRLDNDNKFWDELDKIHNIDSYKRYLQDYPKGVHSKEAQKLIEELTKQTAEHIEREHWNNALSTNTNESFKKYLELHPDGIHAAEAKIIAENNSRKTPASEGEDSSETPSEDPDCRNQEEILDSSSDSESSLKDTDQKENGSSENSNKAGNKIFPKSGNDQSPESNACKTDSEENNATDKSGKTETVGEETISEGGTSSCRFNQAKMVNESDANHTEVVSIPKDVNPSDGIDRVEFEKLQETALSVFNQHRSIFNEAFSKGKFDSSRSASIAQCFKVFWHDLEELVFKK